MILCWCLCIWRSRYFVQFLQTGFDQQLTYLDVLDGPFGGVHRQAWWWSVQVGRPTSWGHRWMGPESGISGLAYTCVHGGGPGTWVHCGGPGSWVCIGGPGNLQLQGLAWYKSLRGQVWHLGAQGQERFQGFLEAGLVLESTEVGLEPESMRSDLVPGPLKMNLVLTPWELVWHWVH